MLEVIEKRRSIRKYLKQEVKDEDIEKILSSAIKAPSGNNLQPWRFKIIKDDKLKEEIVEVDSKQVWMLTAPVFIAILGDTRERIKTKNYCACEEAPEYELKKVIRDCSNAAMCLMLEAENLGLSTCWTGAYKQIEMKKVLNVPDYYYVCGILTVGYSDQEPTKQIRKELQEFII